MWRRWHIPYYLGVDVGTTYTAAAVWRDGHADVWSPGGRAAVVPSVVFLRDDGELLIGEAAERRAVTEPARAAREFKRRVGDSVPVLLGGSPFSADALMAKVLRWTVNQVAEREGGPPAGLVVTHPANWGPYKQELLRQAIGLVELAGAGFVAEPEAAAIHYAVQERTAPGTVVAVYDLGGGTFDAAVLRRTDAGWAMLGQPRGIERLGGIDFDEAVFQRVRSGEVGAAVDELDPDEPATWSAVARLRQESVAAKEALTSDTAVDIPVLLPNLQRDVRMTRSELEQLLRPSLLDTVGALRQALHAADVEASAVDAVLLVGGSSRIPLVAEMVGAELGRPVAIDVHPKHAVALGAAVVAAGHGTWAAAGAATTSPPAEPAPAGMPGWVASPPAAGEPTAILPEVERQDDDTTITLTEGTPVDDGAGMPAPPGGRRAVSHRALVAAVAAVVIGGAGAAAALAIQTDPDGPGRSESTTTTQRASTTTTAPAVPVPDVVGLTEQQARDRLAQAGLQAQATGQPTTDADEDGVVLAQVPPADDGVDRGAAVRLTVGHLQARTRPTSRRSPKTSATTTSPGGNGGGGGGSTSTTPTTTPPTTGPATTSPPTTSPPPTTAVGVP